MTKLKNPFTQGTWEQAAWDSLWGLLEADVYDPRAVNLVEAFNNQEWGAILQHAYLEYNGDQGMSNIVKFLAGKQRDYGPQNILKFGQQGLKVRLWDKIARIENLKTRNTEGVNESLNDSYLDLVGYCVIMGMLEQGHFTWPLEADQAQQPQWREAHGTIHSGDTVVFKTVGEMPAPEGGYLTVVEIQRVI